MSIAEASETPSLSIVVLAYDEEENVEPILAELTDWLRQNEPQAEIVFVDDGSGDRTLDRARGALSEFASVFVRHEQNRGMGAGLKSGTMAANAPWVTFLPADGQVPPLAIGRLRAAAGRHDADVVLSVYEDRDDGLHRTFLSWGVRALIRVVHGVRLRSDGPYLFRRSLFLPEQLPPDTFFLNFEFPIRVLAAGLSVATVEIPCRPRRAGHSKTAALTRAYGVGRDLLELRLRKTRAALRRARGA